MVGQPKNFDVSEVEVGVVHRLPISMNPERGYEIKEDREPLFRPSYTSRRGNYNGSPSHLVPSDWGSNRRLLVPETEGSVLRVSEPVYLLPPEPS